MTVLGTGLYEECKYADHSFTSSPTRFVQQAMLEKYKAREWGRDDLIIVLLTDSARMLNWDVYERRNRQGDIVSYLGLQSILCNMQLVATTKDISIPDGKNESEMWELFNIVYGHLNEGDELYLDLTHSFRYLPMLLLVLINYAKFLKNIRVSAVSYGNYEARADNIAPIVDLMPISALQDWTFAVGQYLDTGNADMLNMLSNEQIRPILTNPALRETAIPLRGFLIYFMRVIDERRFCRGKEIVRSTNLHNMRSLAAKMTDTIIPPLSPLFEKIMSSVEDFDNNENVDNMYYAVRWCFDNGLYQQATTLLIEYVVSFVCVRCGLDIYQREDRSWVNNRFGAIRHANYDAGNNIDQADEAIFENNDFIGKFSNLTELRNDFNHAGMRPTTRNANQIRNSLEECIEYFGNIPAMDQNEADTGLICKPALLINLSNHPYSQWSKEQITASKKYAESIIDMSFPEVCPDEDENFIEDLADKYVSKILKKQRDNTVIVHIMGEMNLSVSIIKKLTSNQITCIASTSKRQVLEGQNGCRESFFKFVRFREYKC